MKLVLAALLVTAVVAEGPRSQHQTWKTGKIYRYDVEAQTYASMKKGSIPGMAIRAQLHIRAVQPGRLHAKFENTEHKLFHDTEQNDNEYKTINHFDQKFEIIEHNGRFVSLNLPHTMSLQHENIIKGIIGSLQVDLTTDRVHDHPHNYYDRTCREGMFTKMETDVTGDCETLYTISPASVDWRRHVPNYANDTEDVVLIKKSKDYKNCAQRVDYHFGVPEYADWTSNSHTNQDKQFMDRYTGSKLYVSQDGTIYRAKTVSKVQVNPLMYGKQKAEVVSYVRVTLQSMDDESQQWTMPENMRSVRSLLYSLTSKPLSNDRIKDVSSSSSSSSESHESEEGKVSSGLKKYLGRVRRFAFNANSVSSSSSSSSSESNSNSAYINDEMPLMDQPVYASLYLQPQVEDKVNPAVIQKLLNEISKNIQSANNIPKNDPLTKFNILVHLIGHMNAQEIKQTSRPIESIKASNDLVKTDVWNIYRDAVVQSGTMAAYQQIKTWLLNKRLHHEEAAQVVAALPNTLKYPTKELMLDFFKLAFNDKIQQEPCVNSTIILAACKFINMAHVNNETAHTRYPTHMYGRLARKNDPFVQKDVLPRLKKELEEAVRNKNSYKAQIYVKALGIIGHPDILDVLIPYLHAKYPMTTYFRTQIIQSLEVLVLEGDVRARAALFSILSNPTERYEVRVAAIHEIMKTELTQSMLYAMAEMTHHDPSVHVRATLTSLIKSIARLENPHLARYIEMAKKARNLLTNEEFSDSHKSFVYGSFNEAKDLASVNGVFVTHSKDYDLPKTWQYMWRHKVGGWLQPGQISGSISSYSKLTDYIVSLMTSAKVPETNEINFKYSAEKIAKIFNIKMDKKEPLEMSLFFDLMNQQRYFALSEDRLMHQIMAVKEMFDDMAQKSQEYHYTKVFNNEQVSIMFPVAMGVPFVFKYKEPVLVHVQGKAEMGSGRPSVLKNQFDFTFARNLDGSVGFFDTLSNSYSTVGITNKVQVNLPLQVSVGFGEKSDQLSLRLAPLHPEQDTTIMHYSVWPYSSIAKRDSHVPVSLDASTKVISRENKVSDVDTRFGVPSTGMQFQFQGYSYSLDYENLGNMFDTRDKLISRLLFPLRQQDVALTHYNFRYLGKKSQTKGLTIKASVGVKYNDGSKPVDTNLYDSEDRRQKFVNIVNSGVETPNVVVVDIEAEFEGEQKREYGLTLARSRSYKDLISKYAFLAITNIHNKGLSEIEAVATVNKPQISVFNLVEALQRDIRTNFQVEVKSRHNTKNTNKFVVKGHFDRSQEYTDKLKHSHEMKQCKKEMERNNYYQPTCRNNILKAYKANHLKATVTYETTSEVKNIARDLFTHLKGALYWYTEKRGNVQGNNENIIELETEISPYDYKYNISLSTPIGSLYAKNVDKLKAVIPSLLLDVYNVPHDEQYCAIDGSRIRTFSNRTYDYKLDNSWHVVMHKFMAKDISEVMHRDQLVVLARRPSEKTQEVYISYNSPSGRSVELELKPSQNNEEAHGIVNVLQLSGGLEDSFNMIENKIPPVLRQYTLADKTLLINIDSDRLVVLYDGRRFVLLPQYYNAQTRGLCGAMTTDVQDDYITPYGLVFTAQEYGASYSLNDKKDIESIRVLHQQIMINAHQPRIHETHVLRADKEWIDSMKLKKMKPRTVRSHLNHLEQCQKSAEHQFYEEHGQICITKQKLSYCTAACKKPHHQSKAIQVVCRSETDEDFKNYMQQINQGQTPEMYFKDSDKVHFKNFRVAVSCL